MRAKLERLAVTVDEACDLLGLSRSSIYRMFAAGRLHPVEVAGRTLIPYSALKALIDPPPPSSGEEDGPVAH